MEKKEFYRRHLPHYQQPGQEYFITKILKNAIPYKMMKQYTAIMEKLMFEMEVLKNDKTKTKEYAELKNKYYILRNKYIIAFDDLLAKDKSSNINLNSPDNEKIMFEAFRYYEGKRLENYAFCVMRNHYHWVIRVFDKDENGKPVYLQDILKVVNGVSANKINKVEDKTGRTIWQSENFDITIRNDRHWHNAVLYSINNPVKAGIVNDWRDWSGTWCAYDLV